MYAAWLAPQPPNELYLVLGHFGMRNNDHQAGSVADGNKRQLAYEYPSSCSSNSSQEILREVCDVQRMSYKYCTSTWYCTAVCNIQSMHNTGHTSSTGVQCLYDMVTGSSTYAYSVVSVSFHFGFHSVSQCLVSYDHCSHCVTVVPLHCHEQRQVRSTLAIARHS